MICLAPFFNSNGYVNYESSPLFAFVNDELDRIESAGRNLQKLRRRLKHIGRSYGDFVESHLRKALQPFDIDVLRCVNAPHLHGFASALRLEFEIDSSSERLALRIQDSNADTDVALARAF